MELAIQVQDLSYRFGPRLALDRVSFDVRRGEVFGVLGPNGAGKTTAVRCLNGLYRPEPGHVSVWGFDPATHGNDLRAHTGVLTESPSLNELLSVEENLSFYGTLYGVPRSELPGRIKEVLEELGLGDRRRDKAGTLSKGLKQRLAVARSILHDPPVLFLDEPTSGLDPESAVQVNDLILSLKARGHTVFLCTHRLTEAERVCDRFAFFSHGTLLATGSKVELEATLGAKLRVSLDFVDAAPARAGIEGARPLESQGATAVFEVEDRAAIARLVAAAVAAGSPPWRVAPGAPSLEDLYFALQARQEVTR